MQLAFEGGETLADRSHFIEMNGRDVFKFAVRVMGSAAEEALAAAGYGKADIDLLIPHQANIRIIQSALERLASFKLQRRSAIVKSARRISAPVKSLSLSLA